MVTANKALLATHGKEIFETALANNSSIGFEASVCGGVPVIDAIRDGMVANRIDSIHGIVNGTTNYILTRMIQSGGSVRPGAVRSAEQGLRGSRSHRPTCEAVDAAHKLVLLANLGFHSMFDFGEVFVEGIDAVNIEDVQLRGGTRAIR